MPLSHVASLVEDGTGGIEVVAMKSLKRTCCGGRKKSADEQRDT